MKCYRNKYLKIGYLLICIAFHTDNYMLAQNTDSSYDDEFSTLAFGTNFTSNNNLNGQVSRFNAQPVLSGLVSYYHKWGIDATVMFSNIWNSDETNSMSSQETDLSIAYDYDFTNWLNANVAYNHYFYSKNSFSIQSDYEDLFSLSLYSEVDGWITNAMLGYYSGKANELFVNVETGVDFSFDDVFKKGNVLSIQPMISIYAGNIDIYRKEAYQNYYFLYRYSVRYPGATVNDLIVQLQDPTTNFEHNLSNKLKERPALLNKVENLPTDLVVSSLFEEQKAFGLSSMGFVLPIYYAWGNFLVNTGVSAYKPINQPSYVDDSWTVYTNIGVTYVIAW